MTNTWFQLSRFEEAFQAVQMCSPFPRITQVPSVQAFESLASTNQTLWTLLHQGAPVGTVVVAAQQSAGRGQWGRQWASPLGGLYLSIALAPNLLAHQAAQLTFCVAWGIATALREFPGRLNGVENQLPVQIKWPNDLVLQGRKLGGILTETRLQGDILTQAVVGIGINWRNPVPESGISLKSWLEGQTLRSIESFEMLTAITLTGALSGYQQGQHIGIEAMLSRYLDLLVNLGQSVVVEGQRGTIVGVLPTGELQVRIPAPLGQENSGNHELYVKPGTIRIGYS